MSSLIRTRWAAIGAALAVTLGAGGLSVANAVVSSGERAVFVPITPCRILDTRPAENVPGRQTPLGAGQTLTQNAHGNNGNCTGIPTDATGLSLNVTTTNATSATFLTIWPNGPTRPNASSLNPRPNQPPIPNAVVTDISPTGQFNIFNLNGTVDILIDINGYFVDHNHDDRYYTRTEIDDAEVHDKWISIDPLAVSARGGAVVSPGAGPNGGLNLPGNPGFVPLFEFGFTMPPDHTPNSTVTVEFLWHINETDCTVDVRPNFYAVSRAGSAPRGAGTIALTIDPVPAAENTTAEMEATIPLNGFGLGPGDGVLLGLFRSTADDTCVQAMRITSIRVIYS